MALLESDGEPLSGSLTVVLWSGYSPSEPERSLGPEQQG